MGLTDEQCKQNNSIPIPEIELDIDDTQKEIDQYQKELSVLMEDKQANRLDIMTRESKISKRKEFVSNLNSILKYRKI